MILSTIVHISVGGDHNVYLIINYNRSFNGCDVHSACMLTNNVTIELTRQYISTTTGFDVLSCIAGI